MDGIQKRRKNIRLPGYDYTSPGIYYVTIVQRDHLPLFGTLVDEGVPLNDAGLMIARVWEELPFAFPWVQLDEYVVMPDHFHGLLVFGRDPAIEVPVSLGTVIQRFKTLTTTRYSVGVNEHGWPRYRKTLWLPNYYERVVRNEGELTKFRTYVRHNPYRYAELEPVAGRVE